MAEGRQTFLGSFRFFGHLVWYVFAASATWSILPPLSLSQIALLSRPFALYLDRNPTHFNGARVESTLATVNAAKEALKKQLGAFDELDIVY